MARPKKRIEELCDNSLVKRVKKDGCNRSFKEILNRHEKLFYKTICPYWNPKGIKERK